MQKHFETKIKASVLGGILLISAVFFPLALADNETDQLNEQKKQMQQKLDGLNAQIKQYTTQIEKTRATASTLRSEISVYDQEIARAELQIQAKQTQIDDTKLLIQELEKLIDQKVKEIAENKKILAELIVQLNEYDDSYILKTTLSSGNLSDFLDQVQYTQSFQDKVYQILQKIKDLKARMEAQQKDLEVQLASLEELKHQLEISQQDLEQQRGQKQVLLNQTRGIESNYQKLLSQSKKEEADIQKEVDDLDAQIRKKLGNKSTPKAKGILAYPMDGVLTQRYGNTGFTSLGYSFHNGIDIAAPAGEPIYAAADGIVLYTDSSDTAYGNWVAIKHSLKDGTVNIITLYGHMRSYKVSPGQKVSQGDVIGYEGNTGNTTKKLYGPERGYHIHFGVYDAEGFGVNSGAYSKTYGPYKVPYGYTYNPLDFL